MTNTNPFLDGSMAIIVDGIEPTTDADVEIESAPLWPAGESDGEGRGYGYGPMRTRSKIAGKL